VGEGNFVGTHERQGRPRRVKTMIRSDLSYSKVDVRRKEERLPKGNDMGVGRDRITLIRILGQGVAGTEGGEHLMTLHPGKGRKAT